MGLLEVRLTAGARLMQEILPRERGFLYVLEGRSRELKAGDVAWFEPGAGGDRAGSGERLPGAALHWSRSTSPSWPTALSS